MAKRLNIFFVGISASLEGITSVPIHEDRALHDADIILFKPTFGHLLGNLSTNSKGEKELKGQDKSELLAEYYTHWQQQLTEAIASGKLVVILLPKPLWVSRLFRGNVVKISQYKFLPFTIYEMHKGKGTEILIDDKHGNIVQIWQSIAPHAQYEVYFDPPSAITPSLLSRDRKKIVGGIARDANNVIFLPAVDIESLSEPERAAFAKKFIAASVGYYRSLTGNIAELDFPDWTNDKSFELLDENELSQKINQLESDRGALENEIKITNSELAEIKSLRILLFGTGKPLERSIEKALVILGFEKEAQHSKDSLDENDGVYRSSEGTFLVEAEGKSKSVVNLDKLRQLNDKIDIYLDNTGKEAKGVLAGNAYGETPLKDRKDKGEYFSESVLKRAKQTSVALLRTPDLFSAAKRMLKLEDKMYAKQCRQAIFKASGTPVKFPCKAPNKKK